MDTPPVENPFLLSMLDEALGFRIQGSEIVWVAPHADAGYRRQATDAEIAMYVLLQTPAASWGSFLVTDIDDEPQTGTDDGPRLYV